MLKALVAWRERAAQARNRPRAWIAPDALLIDIARATPADLDALRGLPGITATTVKTLGEEILRVVRGMRDAVPAQIWPAQESLNQAQQDLARRTLDRIRAVANAESISPGTIATRRSVSELIRDRRGPLTEGWRRELIGADLLAMLGSPN